MHLSRRERSGSVLATHHYDKIPEVDNLKEGKVYFVSEFQRLQLTVAFGPVVSQYTMAGAHSTGSFSPRDRREAEREEMKGQDLICLQ